MITHDETTIKKRIQYEPEWSFDVTKDKNVWKTLTILAGESCVLFNSGTKNGCLAASDLFHMFTQSTKFNTFHIHALRLQMFEKCDSSNRQQKWMVAPFSKFYGKI